MSSGAIAPSDCSAETVLEGYGGEDAIASIFQQGSVGGIRLFSCFFTRRIVRSRLPHLLYL